MSLAVTKRISSIDVLRGFVMVLMALDHTRDYFTNFHHNPLDLEHASTAMFFTRWITHFCAPVFVFLAGTSCFLSLQKGKTKKQASLFLLKRGIWLILLEVTLVRLGWTFNIDYSLVILQVIWAIGWSMIFLSAFIFLPLWLIALISFGLIFGHNLLDSIKAESFGSNALVWNLLHEQGGAQINGVFIFVIYPLIPWIGVMSAGYCFGALFRIPEARRNFWLYNIGIGSVLLFILLRWSNIYGDPHPWQIQKTNWRSFLSFINCEKYPPSLLYLLMTLGPSIAILPLLEKLKGASIKFFTVFGRVPMFYYLIHIYVIHALAIIVGMMKGLPISYFTNPQNLFNPSEQWGFGLLGVYNFWLVAVLILYFPCRWYMNIKLQSRKWWLSYL